MSTPEADERQAELERMAIIISHLEKRVAALEKVAHHHKGLGICPPVKNMWKEGGVWLGEVGMSIVPYVQFVAEGAR